MAQEFYMKCPACGHEYNVHKMVYDMGEDFLNLCPLCNKKFPRKEGKIVSANFPIEKK
jgi:uncharacterized Zn finger protein